MRIYYGGHSSFLIEKDGKRVLVDPFMLSGEMRAARPDVICVSHGHSDHTGEAEEISKASNAPVMAVFELANYFSEKGCRTIDGYIGGTVRFDFGSIKYVNALHGGSSPEGGYAGNPCGFVINMGGTVVYHTGDTGLFGDMALIASQTPVDVLLCPIGDKYTMGIEDAARAVDLVRPKVVIPMHYNTFPAIRVDPGLFVKRVDAIGAGIRTVVLRPGESFDY